jgi:hypothetical protein
VRILSTDEPVVGRQEQTADTRTRTDAVRHPGARVRAQPCERGDDLFGEEIRSLGPVDAPPLGDAIELRRSSWSDDDLIAPSH